MTTCSELGSKISALQSGWHFFKVYTDNKPGEVLHPLGTNLVFIWNMKKQEDSQNFHLKLFS